MDCPRCSKELGQVSADGLDIERCSICGGMWLDFALLERLLSREGGILRKMYDDDDSALVGRPEGETLPCPRCEATLLRMRIVPGPVQYYSCLSCYGRWLDGAEVRRVFASPLAMKYEQLFRQFLE